MTEWLCPWCGYLNPEEIRVALKTLCQRCHREQRDPTELKAELERRQADLEREIQHDKRIIDAKRDQYDAITNHICELEVERRPLEEDLNNFVKDIQDLRRQLTEVADQINSIYTKPSKVIYPDQARLIPPLEETS